MNLFWYFGGIFLFLKSYKSSSLRFREDFYQKLNDEIDDDNDNDEIADDDDNDEIAEDEDIRLSEELQRKKKQNDPWLISRRRRRRRRCASPSKKSREDSKEISFYPQQNFTHRKVFVNWPLMLLDVLNPLL